MKKRKEQSKNFNTSQSQDYYSDNTQLSECEYPTKLAYTCPSIEVLQVRHEEGIAQTSARMTDSEIQQSWEIAEDETRDIEW